MITIRSKLLLVLCLLITIAVAFTGYWNYYYIRVQLLELLNTQLLHTTTANPTLLLNMLIDNIALTQSVSMVCLWIILLLITRWAVYWSLKPLEQISKAIDLRNPDYLAALDAQDIPVEIKPLVDHLNHLFARLREAFTREKRFTADASHELRTPLAAIRIQAEVAQVSTDPAKQQKALENVIVGIDRCTHLIHQLAILAQLKPNDVLNDIVEVNLQLLAQEVIAELLPAALTRNLEIKVDTDPHVTVMGNFAALRIMLRNIIDNAIRYSDATQPILVQVKRMPTYVLLRVEDHGPGISPQMHERVFERFFRGLGHSAAGSGLGLAIVDQIVTLHHATIKLGQPQDGLSGLCFDVMFPSQLPAP